MPEEHENALGYNSQPLARIATTSMYASRKSRLSVLLQLRLRQLEMAFRGNPRNAVPNDAWTPASPEPELIYQCPLGTLYLIFEWHRNLYVALDFSFETSPTGGHSTSCPDHRQPKNIAQENHSQIGYLQQPNSTPPACAIQTRAECTDRTAVDTYHSSLIVKLAKGRLLQSGVTSDRARTRARVLRCLSNANGSKDLQSRLRATFTDLFETHQGEMGLPFVGVHSVRLRQATYGAALSSLLEERLLSDTGKFPDNSQALNSAIRHKGPAYVQAEVCMRERAYVSFRIKRAISEWARDSHLDRNEIGLNTYNKNSRKFRNPNYYLRGIEFDNICLRLYAFHALRRERILSSFFKGGYNLDRPNEFHLLRDDYSRLLRVISGLRRILQGPLFDTKEGMFDGEYRPLSSANDQLNCRGNLNLRGNVYYSFVDQALVEAREPVLSSEGVGDVETFAKALRMDAALLVRHGA